MIRKIVSLHVFAALVCLGATKFAVADCASCGGGCPDGGCQLARGHVLGKSTGCASGGCATGGCEVGGCRGCQTGGCHGGGCGLLGKLCGGGHGDCQESGPCRTCDNIWDDYCASKQRCLPGAKYPFQNYHGGPLFGKHGNCNGCAGVGVGIYGTQCCPPKAHGHLLSKLFTHKHKPAPCAGGCADSGCDSGCAAAVSAHGPAPAIRYSQPAVQSVPRSAEPPVLQPTPAGLEPTAEPAIDAEVPITAPIEETISSPSDSGIADPAVPPAPSVTDQTTRRSGSFDWLQRALQLN